MLRDSLLEIERSSFRVTLDRREECLEVSMASDPAESALGLEDPGRDPAHDHAAVAPALDVAREATE